MRIYVYWQQILLTVLVFLAVYIWMIPAVLEYTQTYNHSTLHNDIYKYYFKARIIL